MARHFDGAANDWMAWDPATGGFSTFTDGTVVAVIRRASNGAAGIMELDDGSGDSPFTFFLDAAGGLDTIGIYAQGSSDVESAATVKVADGWCLVAVTKASGTATPRFHIFKWSANTWTHQNGGGTNIVTHAWSKIRIGRSQSGDQFDGDLAALMIINGRVMTDSEIERLPAGAWDRWVGAHDFLCEFKSGRDAPVATTQSRHPDQSRSRDRQTASVTTTGTSRAAVADPPGFRYSRLTRRR